jgi:hypothetical protein
VAIRTHDLYFPIKNSHYIRDHLYEQVAEDVLPEEMLNDGQKRAWLEFVNQTGFSV